MSQVIITDDVLRAKRAATAKQEAAIDVEGVMARWRRNDVTKLDPVERLLGLASLPILGLWALLCGMCAVAVWVLRGVFKAGGAALGGSRSLITGAPTRPEDPPKT